MIASPQLGSSRNPPPNTVISGAMSGTSPFGCWDSAMWRTISRRCAATSNSRSIEPSDCSMSASQPSFSRCGQSVKTDCMLDMIE